MENKNFNIYNPLIFVEKRKLLIVQINFPEQYIVFYNINEDNSTFNLIFLRQIKINKDDPHFSDYYFNSFVFKDKYLLVGTKVRVEKTIKNKYKDKDKIYKNKDIKQAQKENNIINEDIKIKKAGIYIINLDIIFNDLFKIDKSIKIHYIDFCKELYYISQLREDMFICGFNLISEKKRAHHSLFTFNIEETKEEVIIKKIYYKYGRFRNIISSKLINDSFMISSDSKDNQILKIDKN